MHSDMRSQEDFHNGPAISPTSQVGIMSYPEHLYGVAKDVGGHGHFEEVYEESVQYARLNMVTALDECKPRPWTKAMFKLYFFMLVACLNSLINGYDSSLMGGINALRQYREYFDIKDVGTETGIVFAIYTLGNIVGSFVGPVITDRFGRRWGMFVGASIIIVGTGVKATATEIEIFILGRFILGFAVAICQTAGPSYAAEIAHPAWRGTLTGVYNGFWYLGSLPAMWCLYGTEQFPNDMSWRIPVWLQTIASGCVVLSCLFCPETPRWLLANHRPEEARSVLAKYHGEGNRDSPVVILEMYEMMEEIMTTGADKRWWDYRSLFNSRGALWRLACVGGIGLFGQMSGNSTSSYFLPVLLGQLGVEKERTKLLYTALFALVNLFAAMFGARFTDRIGRRRLLLTVTSLFVFWWTCILVFHNVRSMYPVESIVNKSVTRAAIIFIYFFGCTYSFGYTPLQVLYPVECLAYENRAKGMGLYNLSVNITLAINLFLVPIGLERIGFKLFYVFVCWDCLEVAFIYFFFVETKELTLEEINEIFEAPNPRKKSLEPRIIVSNPNFEGMAYDDEIKMSELVATRSTT